MSQLYISSIGVDISSNDVQTNPRVNEKIERELKLELSKIGVKSALTNITGDDIVITSLVPDKLVEETNKKIFQMLKKHAESFDDLEGVSKNPETAGEGVSYAIAEAGSEYGDSIIVSFDTYCGESIVNEMALFVEEIGRKFGYDSSSSVSSKPVEIPGIGYSGTCTDDPVVVITIENIQNLPKLAGMIYGGLLGFDRVYFTRMSSPTNIVPPGVIYTMSAFLNGNVIDLYDGIIGRFNTIG
ncbi:MAG: hypothetical protein PWP15_1403 [Methanothermococcus sp.]|jgi:hypothetical protein|uniref:hypothetical protein n=1 Tax=Methanothermococcus TaxID=155862 RepID=UPI00036592A1|nr:MULTISPECIES: hypothetical protein [Methanothermococcus]MDK2790894.1 hypothetical protein [Methanothermococcus sp.]MDK2988464.1 hypothetical protein [Methanothermococcus sp.]